MGPVTAWITEGQAHWLTIAPGDAGCEWALSVEWMDSHADRSTTFRSKHGRKAALPSASTSTQGIFPVFIRPKIDTRRIGILFGSLEVSDTVSTGSNG